MDKLLVEKFSRIRDSTIQCYDLVLLEENQSDSESQL
jgi:hypothetical protein